MHVLVQSSQNCEWKDQSHITWQVAPPRYSSSISRVLVHRLRDISKTRQHTQRVPPPTYSPSLTTISGIPSLYSRSLTTIRTRSFAILVYQLNRLWIHLGQHITPTKTIITMHHTPCSPPSITQHQPVNQVSCTASCISISSVEHHWNDRRRHEKSGTR